MTAAGLVRKTPSSSEIERREDPASGNRRCRAGKSLEQLERETVRMAVVVSLQVELHPRPFGLSASQHRYG